MVDADDPIRVLVWDEQQPEQKPVYDNFLGNEIAAYLSQQQGVDVRSVKLDVDQGLSESSLDWCRVLVWWGHRRHLAIDDATGDRIVERIKAGDLSLIALHSAHWSTPFVNAMQERTRMDARQAFADQDADTIEFEYVKPEQRFVKPGLHDAVTPWLYPRKFPDGRIKVSVKMPLCVFPIHRVDGSPSQMRCLNPDHPMASGVPSTFTLAATEIFDEPFHVPDPDEILFEERWEKGEWFRSGCIWNLGKGKVFYFRPGHETFPIFKEPAVLKILVNAVRYLAGQPTV